VRCAKYAVDLRYFGFRILCSVGGPWVFGFLGDWVFHQKTQRRLGFLCFLLDTKTSKTHLKLLERLCLETKISEQKQKRNEPQQQMFLSVMNAGGTSDQQSVISGLSMESAYISQQVNYYTDVTGV
jgi:hypothetical protein